MNLFLNRSFKVILLYVCGNFREKYFFAPLTNKTNEENEFPNEKVKGNFACAGQEKSHNKR